MQAPLVIRGIASPNDRGFVLKTWKMQLIETPLLGVFRNKTLLLSVYNDQIDALLAGSVCKLACGADDQDTILGCAVGEPDRGLLHFIYTKPVYRLFGVASRLLEEFPACRTATMWSRTAEEVGPPRGFVYKPSRAWTAAIVDTIKRRASR